MGFGASRSVTLMGDGFAIIGRHLTPETPRTLAREREKRVRRFGCGDTSPGCLPSDVRPGGFRGV